MYGTVPITCPALEIGPGSVGIALRSRAPPVGGDSLARPKSRTFSRPSRVTITFAGFRSRWTTPRSCAAARASARAIDSSRTRGRGRPPAAISSPEAVALDQLHREEADAAVVLEREERDDVRVVQARDGPRLALEAGEAVRRRPPSPRAAPSARPRGRGGRRARGRPRPCPPRRAGRGSRTSPVARRRRGAQSQGTTTGGGRGPAAPLVERRRRGADLPGRPTAPRLGS